MPAGSGTLSVVPRPGPAPRLVGGARVRPVRPLVQRHGQHRRVLVERWPACRCRGGRPSRSPRRGRRRARTARAATAIEPLASRQKPIGAVGQRVVPGRAHRGQADAAPHGLGHRRDGGAGRVHGGLAGRRPPRTCRRRAMPSPAPNSRSAYPATCTRSRSAALAAGARRCSNPSPSPARNASTRAGRSGWPSIPCAACEGWVKTTVTRSEIVTATVAQHGQNETTLQQTWWQTLNFASRAVQWTASRD